MYMYMQVKLYNYYPVGRVTKNFVGPRKFVSSEGKALARGRPNFTFVWAEQILQGSLLLITLKAEEALLTETAGIITRLGILWPLRDLAFKACTMVSQPQWHKKCRAMLRDMAMRHDI